MAPAVILVASALASSGLALSGLPSVAPTQPTVQLQSRLTDFTRIRIDGRGSPQVHDLRTTLRVAVPLWDRVHIELAGSYDHLWELGARQEPYRQHSFEGVVRITGIPIATEHFRAGLFIGGGTRLEGGLSLWAGSDSIDFVLSHAVTVDLWFPKLQAPQSWSEVSEDRSVVGELNAWATLPEMMLEPHIARWHRFRLGAVGPIPVIGYGLVTRHVSVRLAAGTLFLRSHVALAIAGHL